MGMFKNTLLLAQQGNEKAMEKLLNRYDPLLKKCSIIQGHFDEDLYQSLILEFVRAVCDWPEKNLSSLTISVGPATRMVTMRW